MTTGSLGAEALPPPTRCPLLSVCPPPFSPSFGADMQAARSGQRPVRPAGGSRSEVCLLKYFVVHRLVKVFM